MLSKSTPINHLHPPAPQPLVIREKLLEPADHEGVQKPQVDRLVRFRTPGIVQEPLVRGLPRLLNSAQNTIFGQESRVPLDKNQETLRMVGRHAPHDVGGVHVPVDEASLMKRRHFLVQSRHLHLGRL